MRKLFLGLASVAAAVAIAGCGDSAESENCIINVQGTEKCGQAAIDWCTLMDREGYLTDEDSKEACRGVGWTE